MPDRPRSEHRQRQVMLALRVNPEEERRVREAAKAQRVSVASLIRKAVLAAAEKPTETEWGACRRGEAEPFVSGPDEAAIRRFAEDLPNTVTGLVRREIGPWVPADDPATRETEQGNG